MPTPGAASDSGETNSASSRNCMPPITVVRFTLPQRSPVPSSVPCTCTAPARMAARVFATPKPDLDVYAEYRYASLAEANGEWINGYMHPVGRAAGPNVAGTSPSTTVSSLSSHTLGHEIDIGAKYTFFQSVDLGAACGLFLPGDAAKTIAAAHLRGDRESDGSVKPHALAHFAMLSLTARLP